MPQKVYQLCSQISKGKVSTYKIIAQSAYGSPNYARRVGTLLSHCPDCKLISNSQNYDCPKIHCYRVIKSDFHIGGFLGETGKEQVKIKRQKLASEGVFFDQKGYLLKDLRSKVIFKDFL
ncbi:MAG: MGMT family protein [Candidatus Moeniiplasma glomeromycotorum]|nr:MGMT family protein [Candidatus Moeniiplasma glomeromycotorum]MCE8167944.1 MGMT family protein [Candidatus Moeniiplasma glomeromycotorum]MCE8169729.1 MGMT family protein [Candidatus Moeniiplasma glomeromycotorum]